MTETEKKTSHLDWGKIASGVVGALILALQGVNLSEIGSSAEQGNKRMEVLQQLLVISKSVDQSLHNQNEILRNGADLITRDNESLKNQTEILNTLKTAIEERRKQTLGEQPSKRSD
jgi:hypothetical protein